MASLCDSTAALRDNQKWLEKATDAISTYWRRKIEQKGLVEMAGPARLRVRQAGSDRAY
jgi:hypothetical protein